MFNTIFFVGGIHGAGKSTICHHICRHLNLEYLLASALLKWKDISEDAGNKKVKDVSDTQNRLLVALSNTIEKGKSYLLDGHYCLLNNEDQIVNVPLETFKQINPISLTVILGDIIVVKKRLETRDNKSYSYDLLERLQNEELNYAKYLSKTLNIDLNIGTQNDYSDLIISLCKTL